MYYDVTRYLFRIFLAGRCTVDENLVRLGAEVGLGVKWDWDMN